MIEKNNDEEIFQGTRFSFSSNVIVYLTTDYSAQYSGFQIEVFDGYESLNEVDNVYPFVKLEGEAPLKEKTHE